MGHDPYSVGAPSEGASRQDHSDHCLLARELAVAVPPNQPALFYVALTKECRKQIFRLADHPKLAVWEKLRIEL